MTQCMAWAPVHATHAMANVVPGTQVSKNMAQVATAWFAWIIPSYQTCTRNACRSAHWQRCEATHQHPVWVGVHSLTLMQPDCCCQAMMLSASSSLCWRVCGMPQCMNCKPLAPHLVTPSAAIHTITSSALGAYFQQSFELVQSNNLTGHTQRLVVCMSNA